MIKINLLSVLTIALLLASCKKSESDVGRDVLPDGDLLNATYCDTATVIAYNILDDTHIKFTEETLKKYSIPFLCYYHYWFKGHKVMYQPIELIRDESKPNINYCLFWANETWSSRWDGLENQILLKQEYGNKNDWLEHINYLITFFKDPKYIKLVFDQWERKIGYKKVSINKNKTINITPFVDTLNGADP